MQNMKFETQSLGRLAVFDISEQIESAHKWRKRVLAKTKGNARRVRRVSVDELYSEQRGHMKEHLIHDNAHRMLDRYKAAARSVPPSIQKGRTFE